MIMVIVDLHMNNDITLINAFHFYDKTTSESHHHDSITQQTHHFAENWNDNVLSSAAST